jgi:hypothetical protein
MYVWQHTVSRETTLQKSMCRVVVCSYVAPQIGETRLKQNRMWISRNIILD